MLGFAGTILLVFAAAPAHAFCNQLPAFTVKCKTMGAKVERHGGDGSECFALGDGTGTAKACAAGDKSFADAEPHTGGTATATARGGSFSGASSDNGGTSVSHVSGAGGDGDATSDDKGTATTKATGGSEAHTQAFGKCDATATATGDSFANAVCEHNGTHATAEATKGGHAEGFDDKLPICTPGPAPGTAKVRSTGGNCGP